MPRVTNTTDTLPYSLLQADPGSKQRPERPAHLPVLLAPCLPTDHTTWTPGRSAGEAFLLYWTPEQLQNVLDHMNELFQLDQHQPGGKPHEKTLCRQNSPVRETRLILAGNQHVRGALLKGLKKGSNHQGAAQYSRDHSPILIHRDDLPSLNTFLASPADLLVEANSLVFHHQGSGARLRTPPIYREELLLWQMTAAPDAERSRLFRQAWQANPDLAFRALEHGIRIQGTGGPDLELLSVLPASNWNDLLTGPEPWARRALRLLQHHRKTDKDS